MDEEEFIKASDFDDRVDVLPVSDPNASTMAQRIMQYQAAMQLAATSPEIYNMPELHRQMLETLGIRNVDDIIPNNDDIKPVDPITAVQNLINGVPVQAFATQDHDAHIETIVAAQQNPDVIQKIEASPTAQSILANASAYVNQHLTMKFRKQVEEEMGIPLPAEGEPLPADVEKRISDLVAEAAKRVAVTSQSKAEQERIAAQQQDPLIQMREREVAIKEADVQRKIAGDAARIQLDAEKAKNRDEIERERIESQEQIAGASIGQKVASDLLDAEEKADSKSVERYKQGIDIAKDIAQNLDKDE